MLPHIPAEPDDLSAIALATAEALLGEVWLGRKDSNLRMPGSKPGALPLGYAPSKSSNSLLLKLIFSNIIIFNNYRFFNFLPHVSIKRMNYISKRAILSATRGHRYKKTFLVPSINFKFLTIKSLSRTIDAYAFNLPVVSLAGKTFTSVISILVLNHV